MKWSAKITDKGSVGSDNYVNYKFSVLGNDQEIINLEVNGAPDNIQQLIADKVRVFGAAYELNGLLPSVGDTIDVISG